MNRITKKIIDGGKYVRYVPYSGLQAYRKLGEIEDLMEKYNINSVEKLGKILEASRNLFTCCNCKDNETCKYAFDPYNTLGDCLVEK